MSKGLDLSEVKLKHAEGEEKPKRTRRKKVEAEPLPPLAPMFSKENISPLSRGLILIASSLLRFRIKVDDEEQGLLDEAVAECGNAYFPSDKIEHLALLKLGAVLTTIGVKNLHEYREQKIAVGASRSRKEREREDSSYQEDIVPPPTE